MSYYDEATSLSTQQMERARWIFGLRQDGDGGFRANQPVHLISEGEDYPAAMMVVQNGSVGPQAMDLWGPERFSAGEQLFWAPDPNTGNITFKFGIATPGSFKLSLYATQAPDFGRVSVSIDGIPLPSVVDGYAPMVVPSGKIVLATPLLAPGTHEIRFDVAGKNPLSTGNKFGFDAFEIEEQ
jgi:hypothetical protein